MTTHWMSGKAERTRNTVLAVLVLCLAVLVAAWVPSAHAAPSLSVASMTAGAYNADGSPSTQAGAAPWELRTSFAFDTTTDGPAGSVTPGGNLKDAVFDLPPGVIGDPTSVPYCTQEQMEHPSAPLCPPDSQVGIANVDVTFYGRQVQNVPVYNLKPPPGQPAQFGFLIVAAVAHVDIKVRSDGDYGVTASVHNANATTLVYGTTVHLWGVPADSSHDAQRFLSGNTAPGDASGNPFPSGMTTVPFLRNPTACAGPLSTTLNISSWQEPTRVLDTVATSPAVTGCDRVSFKPTATVEPDTRQAGSSSGVGININVPQNDNPDGLATSEVKKVVMRLPAGTSINPSAADGLAACTDRQFGQFSVTADQCPSGSNIGSVTIDTPLLNEPLEGDVYLASPLEQGPAAAAAGRMFRLFLTAHGSGVRVKLAGSVVPDPVTGQLTTTFDNNPQLPFDTLHLQLRGGSRAPLSLPKACGTYTATTDVYPWSNPDVAVTTSDSFTVDQRCDRAGRFEPTLDAGLVNPVAGGSSPLTFTLTRPDGQQDVTSLNATLPPGLLGRVGSVPLCPDAAAAAGGCPASSQIGQTTVASGAGETPVYLPQAGRAPTAVYLAGPYNGAPYSLSVVVPAQAGPFDLGTVVVRAALFVDPVDAHVTVVSDPLPTILDGVPLNIQKINVTIDRPGFTVNPTSCAPMTIGSKVWSSTSAVNLSNRFQVGGCASLRVDPKLTLGLSGKGQTTDGKHPTLTAHVTMPASGQANLKRVKVALPLSLALDPDNSQSDALCEFDVGRQTVPNCPASSIVGSATAVTPLLAQPLTGPVYFVKNVRTDPKTGRQIRTLPTLAIPLRGGGITIVLRASSQVVDNRLVTTFDTIPDAPVSDFKLLINGGKKDILVVSGADICKASQIADQQIDGQNGKPADADVYLQTPSCPTKIISKKVGKTTISLKVGGLGAGKVTVTGAGIRKTTKTIAKSTVATITAKRSRGRLGKVTVSFLATGTKNAKTTSTTLK